MLARTSCLCCLLGLVLAVVVAADDESDLANLEMRAAEAVGEQRMELLIEVAKAYDARDSEQQVKYAGQAVSLAVALGDSDGEARALFAQGCGHLDRGDTEEAVRCFARAEELFAELGKPRQRFDCIKNTGWVYENAGDLEAALAQYESALELAREIGHEMGEAVALQYIGVIHVMSGQLDSAVEQLLAALAIQERLGGAQHIANVQSCLGSVYSELGQYDKALRFFERSLEVCEREGNRQNEAIAANNIGIVYRRTGRPREALQWYERSLAIAEEIGDLTGVGRALHNVASCYADLGEIETSRRHDLRALEVWRKIGNRMGAAETLANLGEGYLQQDKARTAIQHLEESIATATELGAPELRRTGLHNRSEAHEALGEYEQALADYRESVAVGEQIRSAEVQATIAELETRYETEKSRRQIDLLEKDLQIQALELSRLRFRSAAILAGLALLALLVALFFRRYLHLLAFWKKRNYISHFKLERMIGSGGMGVVYQASDLMEQGRSVALKVIRTELSEDPAQRKRFLNEAYLVDKLNHPNIVRIFERGEHQQTLWIAMELLEGSTLAEVIGAGRNLPIGDCLSIMQQLTDAVTQIHDQGILHRDVKPENVMLVAQEQARPTVKLLDFGLAKAPSLTRLTATGEILGTVTYLAPEQITRQEVTPASDVYALGVVFYELLTLEKPFWGDNPGEIVRAILDLVPLEPERLRPEVPAELSALVSCMIDKDHHQRPCCADVAAALARIA